MHERLFCLARLHFPGREASFLESLLQTGGKLTAEDAAEHLHRQEESVAWVNPVLVIERKTASRDHAVNMRMNLEILSPGVQDTEESDLSAEMLGVGGDLQKRCRAGVKQEIINDLLVP